MPAARSVSVGDGDVFAPTEKGRRHLKSASSALSCVELQALVLADGALSVAQIVQRIPDASREEVLAALGRLAADKLILSLKDLESDVDASGFSTIAVPAGFFSGLAAGGGAEADEGLANLKAKGFHVCVARRRAEPRQEKPGWKPTIMVADDDPDLQKLFRMYLSLEGFNIRSALNREQIAQGLAKEPRPDLVLLDVNMPDVNGFDVLAKMRLHPVFKSVPVIMLTAEASREAVLKGLRGGAEGYVTKPFEPETLVSAVKAVLGLFPPPDRK